MFDNGYENGFIFVILDVFCDKKVFVVFFVIGYYLKDQLELVKCMVVEGYIVGNYFWSYLDMIWVFNEKLKIEFEQVKVEVNCLIGQ